MILLIVKHPNNIKKSLLSVFIVISFWIIISKNAFLYNENQYDELRIFKIRCMNDENLSLVFYSLNLEEISDARQNLD